jgi:hypothetical protein
MIIQQFRSRVKVRAQILADEACCSFEAAETALILGPGVLRSKRFGAHVAATAARLQLKLGLANGGAF